jgi:LuxR family maltose regulon positive regulatory protein
MTAVLLTTKLYVPPVRPELVARSRLVQRLQAGLRSHRLTLISAPAGFGKTTLVTEWLQGLDCPVAWLSLDEGDNDPVRFFTYLVAALQGMEGSVGSTVQSLVQAAEPPPLESLVTALINDVAARPTPFVLVLDDYHLIGGLAVHEAVGFMLEHQPPQRHLVIATREDPPLPLPRLRARGQMTELRASDLRFTAAEAAAFLRQTMGLNLTPGEVAALGAKTEGWIAGLQLAALALQTSLSSPGQADCAAFVRRFAGDDRHVMDYLVDEVLARQSRAVQRFLLRTSIQERLTGPLCDAVVGEDKSASQGMLERLEWANLFVIPLDNRREWYRYHHLFADLLRYRLRQDVGGEGSRSCTAGPASGTGKMALRTRRSSTR